MKRPIRYYCDTWQQGFLILEGWKRNAAEGWLKKHGFGSLNIDHQGATFWREDGTGDIIIVTTPASSIAHRMAILAHECVHAAHTCLKRCGARADWDNDEQVTYLVTILMRRALGDKT